MPVTIRANDTHMLGHYFCKFSPQYNNMLTDIEQRRYQVLSEVC